MHAAAVQEEAGPSLHGGSGAERLPAPQPQDGQSLVRELDANIHVHRYVRGLFTKRKGFKGGRRAETRVRLKGKGLWKGDATCTAGGKHSL